MVKSKTFHYCFLGLTVLLPFLDLLSAFPRDCEELRTLGQLKSGTYTIYPNRNKGIQVYCDMITDGGGWTVIQRRGSKIEKENEPREDFYRTWAIYERGFGSPIKDYWIGLANFYALTNPVSQELRIELSRWCDEETEYEAGAYGKFSVSPASSNYTLSISDFSGNIGDAMSVHSNYPFSTSDRDNDPNSAGNCAELCRGAWWYTACHAANLNGEYLQGTAAHGLGIQWEPYTGYEYSLKRVEMKVRSSPPSP